MSLFGHLYHEKVISSDLKEYLQELAELVEHYVMLFDQEGESSIQSRQKIREALEDDEHEERIIKLIAEKILLTEQEREELHRLREILVKLHANLLEQERCFQDYNPNSELPDPRKIATFREKMGVLKEEERQLVLDEQTELKRIQDIVISHQEYKVITHLSACPAQKEYEMFQKCRAWFGAPQIWVDGACNYFKAYPTKAYELKAKILFYPASGADVMPLFLFPHIKEYVFQDKGERGAQIYMTRTLRILEKIGVIQELEVLKKARGRFCQVVGYTFQFNEQKKHLHTELNSDCHKHIPTIIQKHGCDIVFLKLATGLEASTYIMKVLNPHIKKHAYLLTDNHHKLSETSGTRIWGFREINTFSYQKI